MRTLRQAPLAFTGRTAAALLAIALAVPGAPLAAQRTDAAGAIVSDVMSARRDDDGVVRTRSTNAISDANATRLDRALDRAGFASYWRLADRDRDRLHQAFTDLLPGERPTRYRLNEAQARAIVFLALDDDRGRRDRRDDRDRDRWDDRRDGAASIARLSRDAGVVHEAIAPLRRTSRVSLGREQELRQLETIEERARQMAVAAARLSCPAARDRASELLDLARTATARHRTGVNSAWMTVGDDRLARMQVLARDVEREALRCDR